jgi:3-deoxy-manno-octulosonate cytidylyltransferase (CMP-KDO synthetase)
VSAYSVVIPARYGSSRLPGKPLADIAGKPMIVRVAEQVARSDARDVVVATDHPAIQDTVHAHGFIAEMTHSAHRSGSDRIMEVATRRGWPDDHIVVNVQGDEPLVPPAVIDQVAAALARTPDVAVATICEPLTEDRDLFDPNVVKVVRRADWRALYFSRAPIPWWRDAFGSDALGRGLERPLRAGGWYRHIGIYGYRVAGLRRFCDAPPTLLESLESLEQLRMLEIGLEILVEDASQPVPGGVDTAADLERVSVLVRGGAPHA